MSDTCNENVIEFLRDQKEMTVTFSQGRFKSKIRKMAEKYPNKVRIVAENDDGTICAKLPVKALHLYINEGRSYTDDEREKMRQRMKNYHKSKQDGSDEDDFEEDDFEEDDYEEME